MSIRTCAPSGVYIFSDPCRSGRESRLLSPTHTARYMPRHQPHTPTSCTEIIISAAFFLASLELMGTRDGLRVRSDSRRHVRIQTNAVCDDPDTGDREGNARMMMGRCRGSSIHLMVNHVDFVFPRYDKKLTCCVFDPSLLHPTVSHHELARNTFTFIYKHMYLRDLEEDSFYNYPGPPICILLY